MRLFRYMIVGSLLMIALAVSQASAQTSAPVTKVLQAEPLTDASSSLHYSALSPDGSTLAWIEKDQFCLFSFADKQKNCTDTPPNYRGFGQYSSLSWSPDGKTLVFTEDPFVFALESDIWTYDVASGTFQDRTDDNVFGSWFSSPAADSALIDYLPLWNPANGDLYFFRSTRKPAQDVTTALELMPLSRTQPKQIADYSTDLPVFSIYKGPAMSPDGKYMAITVLSSDLKDSRNGVYILSLKDGSLNRVMVMADLNLGLPNWAKDHNGFFPEVLQWAGNNGLVVWAQNEQYIASSIGQMAYYIDLTAKKITALTDFTSVPDFETFIKDTGDPSERVYHMPRQGVTTPDGKQYLFMGTSFANQSKTAYLFALNVPPDGSDPMQIGTIESFQPAPPANSQPYITPDGKHALLYGYWLTFGSG